MYLQLNNKARTPSYSNSAFPTLGSPKELLAASPSTLPFPFLVPHRYNMSQLSQQTVRREIREPCKQAKVQRGGEEKRQSKFVLPNISYPANEWDDINLSLVIILCPIPNVIYLLLCLWKIPVLVCK